VVGKKEYAAIDVDAGNPEILSEPAGIEVGGLKRLTTAMMIAQAVVTGVARHMVGHRDAVPDTVVRDIGTHFNYFTGNLMTEDQGRTVKAVPFHAIGTAQAAGLDANQYLIF
jgi:hypothetical protein